MPRGQGCLSGRSPRSRTGEVERSAKRLFRGKKKKSWRKRKETGWPKKVDDGGGGDVGIVRRRPTAQKHLFGGVPGKCACYLCEQEGKENG